MFAKYELQHLHVLLESQAAETVSYSSDSIYHWAIFEPNPSTQDKQETAQLIQDQL